MNVIVKNSLVFSAILMVAFSCSKFNSSDSDLSSNEAKKVANVIKNYYVAIYTGNCQRALGSINVTKDIENEKEMFCSSLIGSNEYLPDNIVKYIKIEDVRVSRKQYDKGILNVEFVTLDVPKLISESLLKLTDLEREKGPVYVSSKVKNEIYTKLKSGSANKDEFRNKIQLNVVEKGDSWKIVSDWAGTKKLRKLSEVDQQLAQRQLLGMEEICKGGRPNEINLKELKYFLIDTKKEMNGIKELDFRTENNKRLYKALNNRINEKISSLNDVVKDIINRGCVQSPD